MESLDIGLIKTYVQERECEEGGFCFYRLEEPSLADTFYAIEIVRLISRKSTVSNRTVAYVKKFFAQPLKRGFLWGATYAARILAGLGCSIPRKEELKALSEQYLERVMDIPPNMVTQSALELTYAVIETLMATYGCVEKTISKKLVAHLAELENDEGGFGVPPNLGDTFLVAGILHRLGESTKDPEKTVQFIRSCEDEEFGFTNVPKTKPGFLEGVFCGLSLCNIFEITPRYGEAAAQFITSCQTNSGGFRRAALLGIPTLEYTYLAVLSLLLLGMLGEKEESERNIL